MDETPISNYWPVFRWSFFIALLSCYWAVGFYPYTWVESATYSRNGAQIDASGRMTFSMPGIAMGELPSGWVDEVKNGKRFDLEITVKPLVSTVTKSATIFTLSANLTERNIAVEQDESGFLVWVRTSDRPSKGDPYSFGGIFKDKGWHNIHVMLMPDLMEIYIDGSRRLSLKKPSLNASSWSSSYQVTLGNEQSGNRAWLGAMKTVVVTVNGEPMDLLDDNTMTIPRQLTEKIGSVHANWIPFSEQITAPTLLDRAVNLLGFIPLGVAPLLFVRKRVVVIAIVLSAFVSISIEFGQLYLAARTSQTDDILFNIGGGFIGGLIGFWLLRHKPLLIDSVIGRMNISGRRK